VKAFKRLVMAKQIPFAYETVFSHWVKKVDGTFESKADDILELQEAGYFVVLLFVGLASASLSTARVMTRKSQGGHAVPVQKLIERYPRTQKAIRHAAPLADMTIFFDNSRKPEVAFSLVRVQKKNTIIFDCRSEEYGVSDDLRQVAMRWLPNVCGD
jgi:predicted ABC-type ATPase